MKAGTEKHRILFMIKITICENVPAVKAESGDEVRWIITTAKHRNAFNRTAPLLKSLFI